jgi:hypothetical protein
LLCEEVARRELREGDLVGRTLSASHAAALEAMHPNKYNQKRYCLERFVDGASSRPPPNPPDRGHRGGARVAEPQDSGEWVSLDQPPPGFREELNPGYALPSTLNSGDTARKLAPAGCAASAN